MQYIQKMTEIVRSAEPIFENREDKTHVHVKGRADYVTDVDFHVQEYLRDKLQEAWPDIQFMGEEKGNNELDLSGKVWILDPVDGTTNLIHDMRASAISLGLADNRKIVAGVVFNPFSGELWAAEKGFGAYCNGKPIHVSSAARMEDSLIAIGTAPYYHEYADWTFQAAKNVFLRSQDVRRSGSAAIELAYIASGRMDGMFERILQPWDFAAGKCLVEEAGGKLTDLVGRPIDVTQKNGILASNGKIHAELGACLPN